MKFAFIAATDVAFPISVMCRMLGLTSATSTSSSSNYDPKFNDKWHSHAVHENGGTSGREV